MPDFGEPWEYTGNPESGWPSDIKTRWDNNPISVGNRFNTSDETFLFHVATGKEVVRRFNAFASIDLDNPDFETLLILRLLEAKRKGDTTQRACVLYDYFFHAKAEPVSIPAEQHLVIERRLLNVEDLSHWHFYAKWDGSLEEAKRYCRTNSNSTHAGNYGPVEYRVTKWTIKRDVIE